MIAPTVAVERGRTQGPALRGAGYRGQRSATCKHKNHLTVSPPPTYIDNEGKIPLKGGHDMKDTDLVKQQNDYIAPQKTLALIGSATYATKARDALANAAIRAQIIKHSASRAHGGCIYGVVFASHQRPNVAFVLDRAGIFVREYLEYKA